jgi:Fe-S oxidoreductase
VIEPETLWACTSCRACVYECPMMIEHVDAIISMRRHQTLELGATPGKGAEALAELKAADNPGGRALASRLDWATDLACRGWRMWRAPTSCSGWATPPSSSGDSGPCAAWSLLRQAKVDFAVIGAEELDCGDIARRLGDEALFQDLARRNIALLARHRFQADPHRRSPCVALPEERISGFGRAL